MKLLIDFSDMEEDALKAFSARQVAGSDARSVCSAIRVAIRRVLIEDGFLVQEDIEAETILYGTKEQSIQDRTNGSAASRDFLLPIGGNVASKKGDGKIKKALTPPNKTFRGGESSTHKIWSAILRFTTSDPVGESWYSTDIGSLKSTGLSDSRISSAVAGMIKSGWLIRGKVPDTLLLSEEAKIWIVSNKEVTQISTNK